MSVNESERVKNEDDQRPEDSPQKRTLEFVLYGIGILLYIAAASDFIAGNFFGCDVTGVSWSPIALAVVASCCFARAGKLRK